MMRLSTLLLADHAEAVNGKLYVTGGCWNRLGVPGLPAVHPHMTVAAALHVPWEATNQRHNLQLEFVDADGRALLPEPVQGEFETGRAPGMRPGDDTVIVLAFNFNGLSFEKDGTYEFIFSVNGSEIERASFNVAVVGAPTVTG